MTTAGCACGCRRGCVDGYKRDVYNDPPCECKSNAWHRAHDKVSEPYTGGQPIRKPKTGLDNLIARFFGFGD